MSPESSDDDTIDLRRYAAALRRRWKLALVVALVGGAIGFGVATLRPVKYEAMTALVVVPPPPAIGTLVSPATFLNPATFRAIAANSSLAAQIIQDLQLKDFTPQQFLEQALSVEEVRGTNIVRVKVTLADPDLAAQASRKLAAKAVQLTQQISQQDGASIQGQLKSHLDSAQQRLEQAETALLTYKQSAQPGGKELTQRSELYRRQIEQDRLQANVDLATKVYVDLALRYEQSRTRPLGNNAQLQIVDEALPPDRPVSRRRLQFGMVGALTGIALVVILAVIRERRVSRSSG